MKKNNLIAILLIATSPLISTTKVYSQTDELAGSDSDFQVSTPQDSTTQTPPSEAATENVSQEENLSEISDDVSPQGQTELEKKPTPTKRSLVAKSELKETDLYVQDADKFVLKDEYKTLRLNDAIEQGLRSNYDQQIQELKFQLQDLSWTSTQWKFWAPEVKLVLETQKHRLGSLRNSDRSYDRPTNSPDGRFALELGDYTIFNWGKDYALYLNAQETYKRNKGLNQESRRERRLEIIQRFFELLYYKNLEKAYEEQLRSASFVYRLNKEKFSIGKVSKQDFYLARSLYLKAQNEYHQAKMQTDEKDEAMAKYLGDNAGTKYLLVESLDYKKIKTNLEETLEFAKNSNPEILSAKVEYENALRLHEVAIKENLPLPKISMNLGAYTKYFGPEQNRMIYETSPHNGNIDIVATVNATWTLAGGDGFLNERKLETTTVQKEIGLRTLQQSEHNVQSLIREGFKKVYSLQNQLLIYETRVPSLQKSFETVLDNYLSGNARFSEYQLYLNDLVSTKGQFEWAKFEHTQTKLILAKLAGLEDFPGENFEHLAKLNQNGGKK